MPYDTTGKKMKSEYKKSGKTSKPKPSKKKSIDERKGRSINTFLKYSGSRSKSKSY